MGSEPRSRTTRQLAETALLRLMDAAGRDHAGELVVVGGLVPEYLASSAPLEHQGTTDVDIVVSVGFIYDRDELDLGWLQRALETAAYRLDRGQGGWRWIVDVDGFPVKVEFLCDVPGDQSNQVVPLPGCTKASAINLQGPGAALQDAVVRTVVTAGGNREIVTADLGGYLIAKAAAVASRGLGRDFYDLAFVLIHNDRGGPQAAADAVAECLARLDDEARVGPSVYLPRLEAAMGYFLEGERMGAFVYAREAVRTGAADTEAVLVEDASSAAHEFVTRLRARTVR